ncbi:unnamed protein product [Vicia faba]|uniref:Uncharacterized protein n=1 Tax=Vicia faba TaxID=3906 RepID=A0AAV0ZBX0_VICFA|nr:unnamed protein product [Vicia faba]
MWIDEIDQMDCDDEPTVLPIVIGELVEQTMLFKIFVNNDMNSEFEQSFRVKNCVLTKNSGGVEDDLVVGVVHNDIYVVVVQDLGSKFENIVAEEKCGDNSSSSKLIEENVAESIPVKRGINQVADENDRSNSRITKYIKIEKD